MRALGLRPPCSPLFLQPHPLQQREIGLAERPRFRRNLPVRILRRARAARLRSSSYRAFVYTSSSEATRSLLPFSAPAARRHLVRPRPTPRCSKLREKALESPEGRWVGAPWLPVSCCLDVSRGRGAGGSRTAWGRQPPGGAELRAGPCSTSPGSSGALAVGCARSCWAGTVRRKRRPRGRKARPGAESSLPPADPCTLCGCVPSERASEAPGPAAPLGKGQRGRSPSTAERCPPSPALGLGLPAILGEAGLAPAAQTMKSSGRSLP